MGAQGCLHPGAMAFCPGTPSFAKRFCRCGRFPGPPLQARLSGAIRRRWATDHVQKIAQEAGVSKPCRLHGLDR